MSTATRAPAGAGVRSRVQRVLGAAALEPPGMPPSAILVVRSLADPLPGRMAPRPGDVRAPAEWESAVRGALADQWRAAARPARGPVPAGAGAVYFADTAEMIAAFARDAAAGDVVRWWWRALLKGLPGGPVAALTALWAREGRHVPAALEHLAATGDAARVLATLAPPQVGRILVAVAVEWDATDLLAAPPSLPPVDAASPRLTTLTTTEDREDAHRPPASAAPSAAPRRPAAPPWTGFLPADAVPRGLAPEQAALLGVSLLLHRAPLVVRSAGFVARFVRWRAETAASPYAARPSPAPPRIQPRRDDAGHPAPPDRASATRTDASASPVSVTAEGSEADRRNARADRHPSTESALPAARPRTGSGAEDVVDRSADPSTVDGVERADAAEAGGWEVRVWDAPAAEVGAASAACGVFFLVNVLRSMRFHRALDEHFGVPPVIGGWAWVELVARALLGPDAGGVADDPVWRVLAELDGRDPDALPGGGFLAPETEALPDAWIDLFRGDPPSPPPSPLLGMRAGADLRRFLDRVIPVIRARIQAALAAAGADPEESIETSVIRRIGSVEATRTHVDVRMALDQVTLPVRLAGLDATPGWVPELARVVTFYFA